MRTEMILEVRHLSKTYTTHAWFMHRPMVVALADVSLLVPRGKTLALVGASGSGKSTLAMCMTGRERTSGGEILYEGCSTLGLSRRDLLAYRRSVQLIPQEPGASLNPRFPAWRIVSEPLSIGEHPNRWQARALAIDLLSRVGLPAHSADWLPEQFSGGQRARLALARALALHPKLLILDESLAALDLSIQAQIINLLLDLQSQFGLTYILISHDLSLAGHFADQVAVLEDGRVVEQRSPVELFRCPNHQCTQALVAAAPILGSN
jgi:ABC-type dipeptide/oligopeptide/nickel transport system ATPase subunit